MKRIYILSLLLTLVSLTTPAQERDLFADVSDMKGVTTVYISKAMLGLISNITTEDLDLKSIASKLESVQMVTAETPESIAATRKATAHITPKNGYEELLRIKEEGERTYIYMKESTNKINEFILLTDEENEFTAIVITGNITMEEMQQVMKGREK